MRTVTVYRTENGEVIKVPVSATPARETYDAISEKPMSQRVMDAYYRLECEGKPLGIRNKSRVAEIHRKALAAEGF